MAANSANIRAWFSFKTISVAVVASGAGPRTHSSKSDAYGGGCQATIGKEATKLEADPAFFAVAHPLR
jgi:hypothetical protein